MKTKVILIVCLVLMAYCEQKGALGLDLELGLENLIDKKKS